MKHPRESLAAPAGRAVLVRTLLLAVSVALPACTATTGTLPPWYRPTNAHGDAILGVYESRVPCLDREGLRRAGCERLKLALVLYHDAGSGRPTTYVMSRVYVGSGDERLVSEGAWAHEQDSTVYVLDEHAPGDLRRYGRLSEDVLFVLDPNGRPRRGTAAYGYALNRME